RGLIPHPPLWRQDVPEPQAQENVLQRVLQLPVVNATCESLQRTYTSTKEVHPLVASVCEAYERGVKGASSLAVWSMEPVVRRLEPQCESRFFLAAGEWGRGSM
uniref:Perilipin 1 n=1 Tax=Gopherus agassizii TaxID=38772 RepID=A0A452J3B2_9SAUR